MNNPFRGPGDKDLDKLRGEKHFADVPTPKAHPPANRNTGGGGGKKAKPISDILPKEDAPTPEMEKANTPSKDETAKSKAILKKCGWTLSETRFTTDAELFAEFQIPPEVAHRSLVEFQLLRKSAKGFEPEATAQGHVDDSGKVLVKVPIRKQEAKTDTFSFKVKHCSGDWSTGQGTEREVSLEAEISVEHTQVSGIHFPVGKSFIPDVYLKTLVELKSTYQEWRKTHPEAKIVVYAHTEIDEADIAGPLSRDRALYAFSFVIGDVDRWADLAEKERWGIWEQQCMLRALGFFKVTPTGFLGPKTQQAIRDFIAFLNESKCMNINPMLGLSQANIRKELYREYMNCKRPEFELPSSAFRTVAGYPYVGCCAYNRYKSGEKPALENRRAVFVILQESPNFPAKFPCRSGSAGPCDQEVGKPGSRAISGFKCKFYDDLVRVEKSGDVPTYPDAYSVLDPKSYIRNGPPAFTTTDSVIPQFRKVYLKEISGDYVQAATPSGEIIGWTKRSNLGMFYKDVKELQVAALTPASSLAMSPDWKSGDARKTLAKTYNRLGGLMDKLAEETGISASAVLAVWKVESGGKEHVPNAAIIRFENHLLFKLWGKANEAEYDKHFKHGGHAGVEGKSWHAHSFREGTTGDFTELHIANNGQPLEYQVLDLAIKLAGKEIAYQCISIGGCQILISNYQMIGYESASDMYTAFQKDERSHVLGFFDFCQFKSGFGASKGKMIGYLKDEKFVDFASGYNGPGQADAYGDLIEKAATSAKDILPK